MESRKANTLKGSLTSSYIRSPDATGGLRPSLLHHQASRLQKKKEKKAPQLRKSFIYEVTGDLRGSWILRRDFQDTL